MFIVFLIFVGMIMIIQGVYDEKIKILENNKKIEYKFIPRTMYEEQLPISESNNVNTMNMFKSEYENVN